MEVRYVYNKQGRHRQPPAALCSYRDIEESDAGEPWPEFDTLDGAVERMGSYGDRIAITFLPSCEPDAVPAELTFRELHQRIIRAANAFRSMGVGRDDVVAYMLPTLPEAFVTLLGASLAGRVCPVNFMLSPAAIADILAPLDVKVLVTLGPDPDLPIWQKAVALRERMPSLETLVVVGNRPENMTVIDFEEALGAQPPVRRFADRPHRDDDVAVYHTGGSTGRPKLVRHTHGNEAFCLTSIRRFFDFGPSDTIINGYPLFHVAGVINYGIAPLAAGTRLLIPSRIGLRHPSFRGNYWRLVEAYRVTVMVGGPTVITSILETSPGQFDHSSLRLHVSGGSLLPQELVSAMAQRFDLPVRNVWGLTETTGITSLEPIHAPGRAGSCGWRVPGTEIAVLALGPDGGVTSERLPKTKVGLLAVRGPHITPGYVDPRHNQGTFLDGDWFLTGDLGYVDEDERIFLTGRAKDVIIRGGHNIDPLMIEEALMKHPDVVLCAAVAEPNAYSGELPAAFVQRRPGAATDADALIAAIRQDIHEPAAVPKRIHFLESFPTTATGKIFRPALRQMAAEFVLRQGLAEIAGGSGFVVEFTNADGRDRIMVRFQDPVPDDRVARARTLLSSLRLTGEVSAPPA